MKLVGGNLGKGVVFLTDAQFEDLLDKLGFDVFNRYMEKLANFIIKTGMPVNILSADVRMLNGKQYGQMLLSMPESYADRDKLVSGLREMGLTVEEVHS